MFKWLRRKKEAEKRSEIVYPYTTASRICYDEVEVTVHLDLSHMFRVHQGKVGSTIEISRLFPANALILGRESLWVNPGELEHLVSALNTFLEIERSDEEED